MKKLIPCILALLIQLALISAQPANGKKQEVDFVNSYIGTAQDGAGGLYPCVGKPFAMTNFTPQTGENCISRTPYYYEDSSILSFLASHQPAPWMGDYGYVSVMPQVGKLKVLPQERKLKFSHKEETVSPYYYSVKLHTNEGSTIKAEIAASERCAILRFSFPQTQDARIIVQAIDINDDAEPDWMPNLNSKVTRLKEMVAFINIDKEKNEITGYNPDRNSLNIGPSLKNFKGYFIVQFDKSFDSYGTWNNDSIKPGQDKLFAGKRMGAYVNFKTKKNEVILLKIATSFISIEQARKNLKNEINDWDFAKVSTQTRAAWQANLEKIKVEGVSQEQKSIFYTAMYHCFLLPRQFSEYGKYYSAFDDEIHDGVSYNDYSLWDTFRALHPFLIFTQPDRVNDMITSMLNMYKEGGWLPMWPNPAETNIMIGTHADAVIADAYVKGLRGYDVNLAYEAMRKNAMIPPNCDTQHKFYDREVWTSNEARAGLSYYHSLGYIPVDKTAESVSRTLEYALDDYCVAQVAKGMNKTSDYESLMNWSKNYRNLYNKETGFMAPRLYNGDWNKNTEEGFTEGSPWTYLFCAMQDVPGLIDLMGGKDKFAARLDDNFNGNHYAHDNEPGHHYIYLYDYCDQSWKTQELARKHTTLNYRNQPNGINGNDDCGQMSAWYIFSVMGFYPVTPASGIYAIGAPQFPKLNLNYIVDGKPHSLQILANNLSEKNKYVQKAYLDNKPLEKPFISHSEIINSKQLLFEMGPEPNYQWK